MVQMIKNDALLDRPLPLRLRFRKTGPLKYISHLDLNRTFTKAILRSGIPIWYTQGYNPIPKLDFAAPLSVGCESECELLDIKVVREVDTELLREVLNANLPDELRVEEVYLPDCKFTDIFYSDYTVNLISPAVSGDTSVAATELMAQDEIIVFKKSKRGDGDADIKPFIKDTHFVSEAGKLTMKLRLACGKIRSLNPDYVINYVASKLSLFSGRLDVEYTEIVRTSLLREDETDFR